MGLLSKVFKLGGSLLGGPLGGVVGGVVGGIFDNKSQKSAQARANAHNDPQAIRDRYEAAGFNPLLGISNANPNQQNVNVQPQFGTLISNAITQIQRNSIDKQTIDLEKSRQESLTQYRNKKVQQELLRPKLGGIYSAKPDQGLVFKDKLDGTHTNSSTDRSINLPPIGKDGLIVNRDYRDTNGNIQHLDANVSPTSAIEEEFGEIAAEIHGTTHYGKTLFRNFKREHREVKNPAFVRKADELFKNWPRSKHGPQLKHWRRSKSKPHYRQLIN